MLPITESSMKFVKFPEDDCFYIESSKLYNRIKDEIKIVEFILIKDKKMQFIEAKTQFFTSDEKGLKSIQQKFSDSLSIAIAIILKWIPNTDNEFPKNLQNFKLSKPDIVFVLIIKNSERRQLPNARNKLVKTLKPILKRWGIHEDAVLVLNEQMAQDENLVKQPY